MRAILLGIFLSIGLNNLFSQKSLYYQINASFVQLLKEKYAFYESIPNKNISLSIALGYTINDNINFHLDGGYSTKNYTIFHNATSISNPYIKSSTYKIRNLNLSVSMGINIVNRLRIKVFLAQTAQYNTGLKATRMDNYKDPISHNTFTKNNDLLKMEYIKSNLSLGVGPETTLLISSKKKISASLDVKYFHNFCNCGSNSSRQSIQTAMGIEMIVFQVGIRKEIAHGF